MRVSKFLLVVALVAYLLMPAICAACLPHDLVRSIREDGLSFGGAMQIAEELDRLADGLEVLPISRLDADIELLVEEIVAYFAYEDISDACYIPPIDWMAYPRDQAFHVLGSCSRGFRPRVWLNARFANPWSPRWYNRADLLATIVHELAHAQGIAGWDIYVETATQIATVEVLAAMVRDRNPYALVPLLRELQDYADYYAMEIALREGRMDEYRAHMRRTANNAYELASFERALDHWRGNMAQLTAILSDYGKWPWVFIVTALRQDEPFTRPFPSVPNGTGQIELNDLLYVLEHVEDLARDCEELPR